MKGITKTIAVLLLGVAVLSGCNQRTPSQQVLSSDFSQSVLDNNSSTDNYSETSGTISVASSENNITTISETVGASNDESSPPETEAPKLLYMGQASIRVVTPKNKVIYIDPYAGDQYDLPADLILVTHGHFDHNAVDKVSNRADDCQIITHKEAVQNGEHKTFELNYVTVEAVEAGDNSMHDVNECVGYVLTFTNGKSVYVTGDTSKTDQMPLLAEKHIDYAFFCCDGVYNMGLDEAAECAELVGAKHNIPYHNTATTTGAHFSRELAEKFDAPNLLIVEDDEEILIN